MELIPVSKRGEIIPTVEEAKMKKRVANKKESFEALEDDFESDIEELDLEPLEE